MYSSWSAGESVTRQDGNLGFWVFFNTLPSLTCGVHVVLTLRRPRGKSNKNGEDPKLGLTGASERMWGTVKCGVK